MTATKLMKLNFVDDEDLEDFANFTPRNHVNNDNNGDFYVTGKINCLNELKEQKAESNASFAKTKTNNGMDDKDSIISSSMPIVTSEINIKTEPLSSNSKSACSTSEKTFASTTDLQRRMYWQMRKRYSCGICGRTFKHRGHFTNHVEKHDGQREHGEVKRKRFKITKSKQMYNHKKSISKNILSNGKDNKTKNGERRVELICDECGKSFYSLHGLKRHKAWHRAWHKQKFKQKKSSNGTQASNGDDNTDKDSTIPFIHKNVVDIHINDNLNGTLTENQQSCHQLHSSPSSPNTSSDENDNTFEEELRKSIASINNKLRYLSADYLLNESDQKTSNKMQEGSKLSNCDEEHGLLPAEDFDEQQMSHELKADVPTGVLYVCFQCESEFNLAKDLIEHFEREH